MKKILTATFAILLVLAFTTVALADGLTITSASNSISKSGTTVTMGQITNTYPTATKIKHVKYLQRYSGGWSTYTTITSYSYSTSSFSNPISRSVPGGYSYRVVTYHYAYEGTTLVDTEVRTSGSVYVS
jgi:hypothetical protein